MVYANRIGLSAALGVLCATSACAQEDEGLPRFQPGRWGRNALDRAAGIPMVEAPRDTAPPRRRSRSRGPSPEEAVRYRKLHVGARGILEGEKSTGEIAVPVDPDYGGLTSRSQGYKPFSGGLFLRARGELHSVSPGDVAQGDVGDCYFLAALAAVAAMKPDALESTVKDNGDGTYTVRLFEMPLESLLWLPHAYGMDLWQTTRFRDIVVDADFPTDAFGEPSFAKGAMVPVETGKQVPVYLESDREGDDYGELDEEPRTRPEMEEKRELWVMLAEKAFAVLKGDYEAIDGGLPGLGLNAVTGGGSTRSFIMSGAETLDSELREALAARRPVVLGSNTNVFSDKRGTNGIYPNHAYAVTGMRDGKFVIYNPWGRDHPQPMTAEEITRAFGTMDVGN